MDVLDFKNQVIASFFEIKADIIDNDLKKLQFLQIQNYPMNIE
jgi:hypothetical protein